MATTVRLHVFDFPAFALRILVVLLKSLLILRRLYVNERVDYKLDRAICKPNGRFFSFAGFLAHLNCSRLCAIVVEKTNSYTKYGWTSIKIISAASNMSDIMRVFNYSLNATQRMQSGKLLTSAASAMVVNNGKY